MLRLKFKMVLINFSNGIETFFNAITGLLALIEPIIIYMFIPHVVNMGYLCT